MLPPVLTQRKSSFEVRRDCLSTGEAIRLNLGGIGDDGKTTIPGFLIVDLQDHPLTDIRADISDLSMLGNETVTEIYASNCLEHFPHIDTVKVLTEWRRVLKTGGILWISVPDMDQNLRMYLDHGMTPWLRALIWGDQTHPFAFHYINFSFASLAKACYDAGFAEIERLNMMPFRIQDASRHVDNINKKPVSLNVKVTK